MLAQSLNMIETALTIALLFSIIDNIGDRQDGV